MQTQINRIKVAPSILSADFRRLEHEVKAAQDAGADMIHCDVMDGHFVPNLTFGPFIVEAVKKCVTIPLDVHLMISNPQKYIDAYCNAGADILSFHAEAVDGMLNAERETQNENHIDTRRSLLNQIRKKNVRAALAVNPDKPVTLITDVLDSVDMAVIMSVYAGFGGQKFIEEVMEKVRAIREKANAQNLNVDIEVDGGVNGETAAICAKAGANVLVAGSYVFCSDDYRARINSVRNSGEAALL